MKLKTLIDNLKQNDFFDPNNDRPNSSLVILIENHNQTWHGLPSLETHHIESIHFDDSSESFKAITTSCDIDGVFNQFIKEIKNHNEYEDLLNKELFIDNQDFEIGDVGHSERDFYITLDGDNHD